MELEELRKEAWLNGYKLMKTDKTSLKKFKCKCGNARPSLYYSLIDDPDTCTPYTDFNFIDDRYWWVVKRETNGAPRVPFFYKCDRCGFKGEPVFATYREFGRAYKLHKGKTFQDATDHWNQAVLADEHN